MQRKHTLYKYSSVCKHNNIFLAQAIITLSMRNNTRVIKPTETMCQMLELPAKIFRQIYTRVYNIPIPCFSILALPMGMTKSGDSASSDMGNELPYIISFSRRITGLSSLTAAFNRPFASSLDQGDNTWQQNGRRERERGRESSITCIPSIFSKYCARRNTRCSQDKNAYTTMS